MIHNNEIDNHLEEIIQGIDFKKAIEGDFRIQSADDFVNEIELGITAVKENNLDELDVILDSFREFEREELITITDYDEIVEFIKG